jgi:hypothetical protein
MEVGWWLQQYGASAVAVAVIVLSQPAGQTCYLPLHGWKWGGGGPRYGRLVGQQAQVQQAQPIHLEPQERGRQDNGGVEGWSGW